MQKDNTKKSAIAESKATPFLTHADFIIARRTRGVVHFANRFDEVGQPAPSNISRMIEAGSRYIIDEAYGHKANRSFLNGMDEGATAVVWAELSAMGYVIDETVHEMKASVAKAGLHVVIRG